MNGLICFRKRGAAVLLAVACLGGLAVDGAQLVRGGKAAAVIVVPKSPLAVESYAARELQYHIERATGARLAIVPEDQVAGGQARVFLGACAASAALGADPSALPRNSYIVKANGADLCIAGKDGRGDPLNRDTAEGTLFGVYDILESEMQVRWLWPGPLGEIIPQQKDLALSPKDGTVRPLLWFKEWRGGSSEGERVWLKRQRFGRSVQPQYGHSFGKYWERFGQSHPEYFNMLPDGTRRLDPYGEPGPDWVHMCVSQPGLARQVIEDWQERGAPEFLNVCENDGWAGCACPQCLAWDEPDPENPVPFDQRLAAAKRAFSGQEGRRDEWMLQLGSLSDRFARFWERVSTEAAKSRPDVKVVSYVYDNYRRPPMKAMLNSNVLCGLVPQESIFGYSKYDSAMFRRDWSGWERTGCELFLRPNYTLQAPNFPAFYARTLGRDLEFAMARGMKGADFDSLTGKYATEGPSLYMLAKVLNHPDVAVDSVVEEFCAAFGPARNSVKTYFDLWESIYPHYSADEEAACIKSKRKYGAGLYGPYYILAPALYPPEVMSKAWSILDAARNEASGDAAAAARVEWLAKGLKQADLMLAAERAYERGVDSGDKSEFTAAYQALRDFRQASQEYDKTNFAGIGGAEKTWERGHR
ncbi:MAG TPA: DUF4838 domain-containing protein [Verrucomicrobiae bacterium]|jgi:hypothetical protein